MDTERLLPVYAQLPNGQAQRIAQLRVQLSTRLGSRSQMLRVLRSSFDLKATYERNGGNGQRVPTAITAAVLAETAYGLTAALESDGPLRRSVGTDGGGAEGPPRPRRVTDSVESFQLQEVRRGCPTPQG